MRNKTIIKKTLYASPAKGPPVMDIRLQASNPCDSADAAIEEFYRLLHVAGFRRVEIADNKGGD